MRGYSIVALYDPKQPGNVGATIRACYCYYVSMLIVEGERIDLGKVPANTPQAHRHIPTIFTDDLFHPVPANCECVAIDIVPGAMDLHKFVHPERACYIFGPEDGLLPAGILERCKYKVKIPTRRCMNLAATVNVVLYDRLTARGSRNK